ncbi:MAG: hypothetical protein Pars92KO_31250 [Parasphingorhabdus sp.]
MPKIVDHDAYREDLANRAAAYFAEYSYTGASLRKITEYLGISKSAFYHYFPNKQALFLASTKQVMRKTQVDFTTTGKGSEKAKIQQLTDAMRSEFGSEMSIVFDYLRDKTKEEVAEDEAMQIALDTYRASAEAIVGADRANETLAKIMGTLLLEYMSGTI